MRLPYHVSRCAAAAALLSVLAACATQPPARIEDYSSRVYSRAPVQNARDEAYESDIMRDGPLGEPLETSISAQAAGDSPLNVTIGSSGPSSSGESGIQSEELPPPAESPDQAEDGRTEIASLDKNNAVDTTGLGSGALHFRWPVKGKVITKFGKQGSGYDNDGITIAAPSGEAVNAAEDGVVVYAGNELKGYGNLVVIKHRGGWMTAYGHQREFLVKKGDKVKAGQAIGRVGATGNANRPQLHFSIRQGKEAVDPLRHYK